MGAAGGAAEEEAHGYRGLNRWHDPTVNGKVPPLDITDKSRLLKRHGDGRLHFLTSLPPPAKKAACQVCKTYGLGAGKNQQRQVTTGCPGCGRGMHRECFEAWHMREHLATVKYHMWKPPAKDEDA